MDSYLKEEKYLISVIIPVYNIKDYLDKCINSIINQSYKNLQIILVDDGSTDGSSEICDKYMEKDKRVEVFHKKNGGVSSARNLGLDKSRGDYITFVDSDDWIEVDMIEYLLKNSTNNEADISMCDCYNVCNDKKWITKKEKVEVDELLDNKDAIKKILYRKYCVVWSCLFKKEVLQSIRFEEGVGNNEDIYFLFLAFNNTKKVYKSFSRKYNYNVMPQNSITKVKSMKNITSQIVVMEMIEEYIKTNNCYEEYKKEFNFYSFLTNYNVASQLILVDTDDDALFMEKLKYLRSKYYSIIFDKNVLMKVKLRSLLLILFPNIFIKIKSRKGKKK